MMVLLYAAGPKLRKHMYINPRCFYLYPFVGRGHYLSPLRTPRLRAGGLNFALSPHWLKLMLYKSPNAASARLSVYIKLFLKIKQDCLEICIGRAGFIFIYTREGEFP
jgi:hypothetical protein